MFNYKLIDRAVEVLGCSLMYVTNREALIQYLDEKEEQNKREKIEKIVLDLLARQKGKK